MTLSREQRVLRARTGAYALHASHDPRETTRNARETFLRRFEDQVDPAGVLSPVERTRRAEAAKHAHFAQLALKSSLSRSQKKVAAAGATPRTAPREVRSAARTIR